ncbi:MAG TPA: helix-turn-helix domain-containing protein [Kofleriaceae bacterium]|jgi:AraC-like DNA-binding protein
MARLNETRIGALLTEPFGGTFSRSAAASCHAEHGTGVLVGLDADVVIDAGGGLVRGRAVIVPPDVPYAASCPGPVVSYTFDPELCPRIAGAARAAGGPRAIDGAAGAYLIGAVVGHRAELARPDVLVGVGEEVRRVLASGPVHGFDRRVARLVETLRDPAADGADAVARTRLSAAHLQALFARDVGIPMRTYRLWRRLLHTLGRVGPLDLTAAAHAGEFADLAHFSRTCRRMLGYAPSALRANLMSR